MAKASSIQRQAYGTELAVCDAPAPGPHFPPLARVYLLLPAATAYLIVYWCVGRWHATPRELPMARLEEQIPLLVWTVWPYLLLEVASLVSPVVIRNRQILIDMLRAAGVAILFSTAMWLVGPTVYPRPEAPIGSSASIIAYDWLRVIDAPANCFPSGHMMMAVVVAWGVGRDRPSWRRWIWLLCALTVPSLITLKQHYLIDLPGGVAVALLGIQVARRLARRTRAGELASGAPSRFGLIAGGASARARVASGTHARARDLD
jgi:membrane-associated phospholipid phosphatase